MTCTGAGVRCVARCVEQHRLQVYSTILQCRPPVRHVDFWCYHRSQCESLPRTVSSLDPCIMLHDPACTILPGQPDVWRGPPLTC